jgi:hypothetical protein
MPASRQLVTFLLILVVLLLLTSMMIILPLLLLVILDVNGVPVLVGLPACCWLVRVASVYAFAGDSLLLLLLVSGVPDLLLSLLLFAFLLLLAFPLLLASL